MKANSSLQAGKLGLDYDLRSSLSTHQVIRQIGQFYFQQTEPRLLYCYTICHYSNSENEWSWRLIINPSTFTVYLQWNPDFSNTRLFETPDSSNQKSFPLDLFQSNTVILSPIFRMLDFSKLQIFRTNSFFLSKWTLNFSNFKTQEPTKTGFSHIYTWREGVFMHFFITKQVTNLSLKS